MKIDKHVPAPQQDTFRKDVNDALLSMEVGDSFEVSGILRVGITEIVVNWANDFSPIEREFLIPDIAEDEGNYRFGLNRMPNEFSGKQFVIKKETRRVGCFLFRHNEIYARVWRTA